MARARKNDANLRGQADPGRKASVASGMLGHDAGEILITRDAEIRVQYDHAGVSILVGVLGHCSSLAELNLGWNDTGAEGAMSLPRPGCGGSGPHSLS